MCGVYGIIDRDGIREGDMPILSALAQALEHRGPDGGDRVVSGGVALGMQRLSIIDLASGMQPLWNERRTMAVVANGEIYNFIETRRDLEARGHHFAGGSDCEVIVHLYEEYGVRCLDYLRGMFAFALVDFEKRRVILARDRLGEKPLYLAESQGRIVFASELQALIGAGVVPFDLDDVAIRDYFMWGFVPEPNSAVVGTRKLPRGSYLDISLDPWDVKQQQWWSPLDSVQVDGDPVHKISEVIDEVGPLIMRSDVPIGVALSSGVESSLLAALASKSMPEEVNTFTVGYEGHNRHDESELAAQFAATIGTKHHTILLESSRVVADFPRMCRVRDDPIADIAGPAYLALMEAARGSGVPVLLFGHGGDELFWGYQWTVDAIKANLRKRSLLAGTETVKSYLKLTQRPQSYGQGITWALALGGLLEGLRARRRDLKSPPGQMIFWDQLAQWPQTARGLPNYVTETFLDRASRLSPERRFTFESIPERPDLAITDLLLDTYLLGNGIAQADRLSMSTSVECRLPFVDYRLVETVMGLRLQSADWILPPKKWLQSVASNYLPEDLLRRPKRGFTPPWRAWSRDILQEHGSALIGGYLAGADILQNFKRVPKPVDKLFRSKELTMAALTLEMWARGMRDLERLAVHRGLRKINLQRTTTSRVGLARMPNGTRSSFLIRTNLPPQEPHC